MKLLVRARNAKFGFVLGVKEAGAAIMACGTAPSFRGGPSTWNVRLRTDCGLGLYLQSGAGHGQALDAV